jgi:hypothetical protein
METTNKLQITGNTREQALKIAEISKAQTRQFKINF